jgi:hypothetical protein
MGFIVNYAGSLAKLGTSWCSDSSYKHHQLSWELPWWSNLAMPHQCAIKTPCCSDQGADLRQHARGLDKYMADDVGKLSLKLFDPATRYLCNLLADSGTTCVHVILR